MSTRHNGCAHRWRPYLWALGLLALAGLTACGASGPRAGATLPGAAQATASAPEQASAISASDAPTAGVQPTSQPTTPPDPTAQSTMSTRRPVPSPALLSPRPLKPTAAPIPIPPTAPPADSTPAVASAWQIYRNTQAGYSITYPPDWKVDERGSEEGALVTSFTPADAGPGITIAVQAGGPPSIEPSEVEILRCQRVVTGRLTGKRCFNTVTSTISTTLIGKDKTFIIATTGKGIDDQVYQRFLDSFAPTG